MIKKEDTWLFKYRQTIKTGQIKAGQELIMQLDNLIRDLDNPRYVYDVSEAYRRIDFIENCIRLTKSPFYGKPMKLMLFQKAFIEVIYSFKMASTGFDRFKKVILLIGRKNGKSELCSALMLTEMILGNSGSDIVASSNDDTQANILYDAVDVMRKMIDPDQKDTWRNQMHIRNKLTNSKIFKLSDKTRNKEGRNIDLAVIDEVHEQREPVILKSIEQSQSLKDNPKLLIISTEGFVNDGTLDQILVDCRKIINGEEDGIAAERTLPWLYTQDSENELWQDESSWQKSNPTLGVVKKWDYLREQIDLASRNKGDRVFVLSKDFNIKQSNSQAWLLSEDYKYEARFDIEEFRDAFVLGAVDLAETTDLTCAKILLMKPSDNTKYIYTQYFIPESKLENSPDFSSGASYLEWAKKGYLKICEGNENDLSVVADWFYEIYKKYNIKLLKCGYDQRFAKDFLNRMDYYGFECEMVYQNKQTLSNPMKLLEADLKSQRINYNENPIDQWCFGNASVEVDNFGQCMAVKINNQAAKRIDGAVTTIILYEMYRRYRSEFNQYVNR